MKKKPSYVAKKLSYISKSALRLLNTVLPFLLCAFIWFCVSYVRDALRDPLLADHIYRPVAESLMVSLCLLLGGAAILDRSIARGDFDK